MYYYVVWLLRPYTLALLVMVAASFSMWRKHPDARRRLLFLIVPLSALVALSTPVAAFLAMGSLEWSYPPTNVTPDANDTIVVLTGSMRVPDSLRRKAELGESSVCRCQHAAELYHAGDPCLVIVSGGKVNPSRPGPACSTVMREYLLQLGMHPSHLEVEDRSRTTHESAVMCKEILERRPNGRIILVTEASHMARSVACFRAEGLDVVPAACNHQATEFRFKLSRFLPGSSALKDVETAAHEWVGMAWYRLHGRI